jgi:hypothetical protein
MQTGGSVTRTPAASPFRLFTPAVLSTLLLAPSAAVAGPVTRLTTNTAEDLSMDAAVDVSGNVHVVYERDGNVYYRGRAGTTWSAEELVAPGTSPAVGAGSWSDPQVAFLSGGSVLYTARIEGTWTTPATIAAGSYVDMAVGGDGVCHLVYWGDVYGDGYGDVAYTNNGIGTFPADPVYVWNGIYNYWGGGSATADYYYSPVIAVDGALHLAIAFRHHHIDRAAGWTDHSHYLHVYRSLVDEETVSPWSGGAYPDPQRNGLVLATDGTAYLAYGSMLAAVQGPAGAGTWNSSSLPAGSSHTLDLSAAPGLHVAYLNGGAVLHAVDTGGGFGAPVVVGPTTSGRNPVVVAQTDPFVVYEASDGADYEVFFARTTNAAPVLDAIGDRTVNEGETLAFTVHATDADGDALAYGGSGLPANTTLDPDTGEFTFSPDFTQAGSYTTVTFNASDGTDTDSETITITVDDVNAPPVLAAIGDRSVSEGATLSFTVSASDVDPANTLTFSASNLPTGAAFDPVTHAFSWTPDHTQAGAHAGVVFTVTDDGTPARSDSETITITVDNVNRTPVLGAIGDKSVMEGYTLSFTVSATDEDGETLTYSASNLPSGATFDPPTRTFSWRPGSEQAGEYPGVVFAVADGEASDSETIAITVEDNPVPPGFFTVTPCRLIDTRNAAGEYGGPAIQAGTDRTFDVVAGACGIPATARAVSVNVTVTGATGAGNLRLFPAGVTPPGVSTINYVANVTRANNAVVQLGELGEVAVRVAPAGAVHLILDVNGYFQEQTDPN